MKRRWAALVAATTYFYLTSSNPAAAFTAAVAWLVATFTISQFAATVIVFAVGVGLSFLAKKILEKFAGDQTFGQPGTLSVGGEVPRSHVFGRYPADQSLVYVNTYGESNGTPNAFLVTVVALSDLPINRIAELWIGGEKITWNANNSQNTWHAIPEYNDVLQGEDEDSTKYDHLWVRWHDGTQTTADSFMTTTFPETGGNYAGSDTKDDDGNTFRAYGSTRVGKGVAYMIVRARVNSDLFSGFPTVQAVVDGSRIYDVRLDTTEGGSGSQDFADPNTWTVSNGDMNLIQVAYNVIRGFTYDGDWVFGGQTIGGVSLPYDNWEAAMAECDVSITTAAGGSDPQFYGSGIIPWEDDPLDVVERLLLGCNGRIAEIGGTFKVRVGAPPAAVFAFTDDDILVSEQQQFEPFPSLATVVNGVSGRYPSPEEGWNIKDAPKRLDPALETADGGRRQVANVTFEYVPNPRQVQRLMKAMLNEARQFRTHALPMPPDAFLLEPLDVVSWTSTRNGYSSKLFEIVEAQDLGNLDMGLALREIDPTDYDWTFTEEVPIVDGPLKRFKPPPQPVIGWTATGILVNQGSNQQTVAIKVEWNTAGLFDIEGVRVQIALRNYLVTEADGLVIDGTFDGGQVKIVDSVTPGNEVDTDVDTWFTITSSAKWVRDASDVWYESAANTAHFDNHPDFGWGLLLEPAGTNYLLQARNQLGGSPLVWQTDSGVSVFPDVTNADPAGTFNAFRITKSSLTSAFGFYQDGTITGGTSSKTFTGSIWIKSTTGAVQNLRLWQQHNGVASADYTAITATADWVRYEHTVTNSAGAGDGTQGFGIAAATDAGTFDILVWFGQLEDGYIATSPIDTTTAIVTRVRDQFSRTDGAFPSQAGDMSILADYVFPYGGVETFTDGQVVVGLTIGASTDSFDIRVDGTPKHDAAVVVASSSVFNPTTGPAITNTAHRAAMRVSQNDFGISWDGNTVETDVSGGPIALMTDIYLGARDASSNFILAPLYIRNVTLVKRAWTDAELKSRSAGNELLIDAVWGDWQSGQALFAQNIASLTDYQVRGKYIPGTYRPTAWSDWIYVTTPDGRQQISSDQFELEIQARLQQIEEQLPAEINKLRDDLDLATQAIVTQGVTQTEFQGWIRNAVGARYEENKAGVEVVTLAQTSLEGALSAFLVDLFAIDDEDGVAEASFRILASATPEGALANAQLEVRAGLDGDWATAAIELAALFSAELGTYSRLRLAADFIDMVNNGEILPLHLRADQDAPYQVPIVGGNITVDLANRRQIYWTKLTENVTYQFPQNAKPGWKWTHIIQQDGTGSRTLGQSTEYITSSAPTIATAANTITVIRGEIVSQDGGSNDRAVLTSMGDSGATAEAIPEPGSQLFEVSGTFTFIVPPYATSVIFKVHGAGGGGGGGGNGSYGSGGNGGQSSVTSPSITDIFAGGGMGGKGGEGGGGGGAGGTASGGTTNTPGNAGSAGTGGSQDYGGAGGAGANPGGGAGGATQTTKRRPGNNGTGPGGAGGGASTGQIFHPGGGGGGGGAYTTRTYTTLTEGMEITIVVGAAGARGSGKWLGGLGAAGKVEVTWS